MTAKSYDYVKDFLINFTQLSNGKNENKQLFKLSIAVQLFDATLEFK